jgi:hypothetical protein
MNQRAGIVWAVVLAMTLGPAAIADPDGCRNAVDQFKSARIDVADALRH